MPDPLTWKPWPRDPRFLIGNDGTVLGVRGRPLRTVVGGHGYLQISITGPDGKSRAHPVHRMVCETFHGPRPIGMEACHGPGGKHDNSANNLRWATHSDNILDCVAQGTHATSLPGRIGADHHLAVLTEDLVREIRAAFDGTSAAYSRLAKQYGCGRTTIRQVVNRETWKHVS